MDKHSEKARKIIAENRYMTLATSLGSTPWAAAVAYVVDSHFNFYWYSETTARHSLHIHENHKVVVAIFDSTKSSDEVDGVQIEGIASEVLEQDLDRIIRLYYEQSFPDLELRRKWQKPRNDFIGSAPQRFYCFTPSKFYKCDLENISVDRRIEVILS